MSQPRHWSQINEAGALWGMRLLLWCFHWFGRGFFRVLLYPVIAYYFLLRREARAASLDFLSRVHQRQPDEREQRPSWRRYGESFRHFLTYGELLLDKLAVWEGDFDGRITMHGRPMLLAEIAAKRGAVLLVSHLGNTEICQALAEQLGVARVNVLVHTRHAEKFNQLMAAREQAARVRLVQVSTMSSATAIMLEQCLRRGEFVAIAADRTPLPEGGDVSTRQVCSEFLGASADFPQGPFVLAALLQRPVYFMCCVKGDSGYDIHVELLAKQVAMNRRNRAASLSGVVQQYARRLEFYTRRYPLQWGNFYDFWARKPANPDSGKNHDQL